jgi:hypothetical protein
MSKERLHDDGLVRRAARETPARGPHRVLVIGAGVLTALALTLGLGLGLGLKHKHAHAHDGGAGSGPPGTTPAPTLVQLDQLVNASQVCDLR